MDAVTLTLIKLLFGLVKLYGSRMELETRLHSIWINPLIGSGVPADEIRTALKKVNQEIESLESEIQDAIDGISNALPPN